MKQFTIFMVFLSLLLSAAVFGFFYAWVCSTMWGLDAADPRVAIAAMQAMNASVRNAVFFPAFFLTPVALGGVAVLLYRTQRHPAIAFAAAAIVYLIGGFILTATVNVPMNQELALIAVPDDIDAAATIWRDYSQPWQVWNQTRTIASGLAFLLAAYGTFLLDRRAI
ncbi:DUF1772 domain-containing protein [Paracoccus sp. SCSIO 75233]|uniref:anthrone oxygenase family protein n=1 Tax=Paracoccus sp. SCSIO 75233 TaxID=3017782 RepID=UPI0022F01A4E|nr:anthrone oxygenase family protein [Paracoccus sp. SCSIO 75233]WBU54247.1 DUF1772 domain-containing protein [Paracoccus sp. SCSIO 75233]